MIIGVDATSWQNNRGYGRHARSLLGSLTNLDEKNHYVFVLDSSQQIDGLSSRVEQRLVQPSTPAAQAASASSRRSVADLWRMSKALSDPAFDILFFPTIYSFVPVFSRAKIFVMIHDVIADKYPQLTFPTLSSRLFWQLKVVIGRRQANKILTVSDYSRGWIASQFGLNPERIGVVGEASDPVFRVLEQPVVSPRATPYLDALNIPFDCPLVLYVGGFGPHKNLGNLLNIFSRLVAQAEFSDTWLVMVGEYQKEVFYSEYSQLTDSIAKLGIKNRVIFTGYLPDSELVVLMNRGTLLVLPSFMEGFGLPAVEAAACGLPVIATKESPLPSLLGNACIYIDPNNPSDLLAALMNVLGSNDRQKEMRQAGVAAAARLTWDAAARQFIQIIDEMAS